MTDINIKQPLDDNINMDLEDIYKQIYDKWMNNIENDVLIMIECNGGTIGIHKQILLYFKYFHTIFNGNWNNDNRLKLNFDINILRFFRKDIYTMRHHIELLIKSINLCDLIKFIDYIGAPQIFYEKYIELFVEYSDPEEFIKFLENNIIELSANIVAILFEYCFNNLHNDKLIKLFLCNYPDYIKKWISLNVGNINYIEIKLDKYYTNLESVGFELAGIKDMILFTRKVKKSALFNGQINKSIYKIFYFQDKNSPIKLFNYIQKYYPRIICNINSS